MPGYDEIERNMVMLTQVGSQAYGTNTPESDEDLGGVCIPPLRARIGLERFDQADKWTDEQGNKIDKVVYSIVKAVNLMLGNNPNMMDYLFMPDRCIKLLKPEWEKILEVREKFISTKCYHTYSGYAFAQMERLETHRRYLRMDPPPTRPNRADFGLPERSLFPETQHEAIAKISTDYVPPELKDDFVSQAISLFDTELPLLLRRYADQQIVHLLVEEIRKSMTSHLRALSSISSTFLKDEYVDLAQRELRYLGAVKDWQRYEAWKKGRNSKRLELEQKCGYDSKHASHAIRLMTMATEILDGKGILVDRTGIDAEMLLDIRKGNWSLDQVLDLSKGLEQRAKDLYDNSSLPREPDRPAVFQILEEVLTGWRGA